MPSEHAPSSATAEANRRITNAQLTANAELNLSELGLTSTEVYLLLPEIAKLTALQALDLSYNQLASLPPEIAKLTALQTLNLRDNQLTALPPEIAELTALQTLHLSDNQLATLPPEIAKLTALQTLYLSSNQLATLPPEIAKLTALQTLTLHSNQLATLPPEIAKLTALQTLTLHSNQLATLPLEITKLTVLQTLRLSSNELVTLPPEIAKLTALQTLTFHSNQLATLPLEITKLTALQTLGLSSNQLTTLPPEIAKLTALRTLDLSGNQLTTLPPAIAKLTALSTLDLSDNQLTTLPREIAELASLQQLFLHGNEGLGLPPEVLGPLRYDVKPIGKLDPARPADILNHYFALQRAKAKGATNRLNEAKLLLVGQGGVGKTSLVKRLTTGEYDPLESKTEGIGRTPWKVPGRYQGENVTLNVWDFGGQEVMHATHQFFLTKRSIYLVVIDARKGENEGNIHYWLKIIQTFGGDSPVIVVTNMCDGLNDLNLNETGLKREYPSICGFVKTSCETKKGLHELKALIVRQVAEMRHIYDELPDSHFKVKQSLAQQAQGAKFLGEKTYRELCTMHGVTAASEQDSLLRLLHDLGTILNYNDPDNPYHLNDAHILDPEWVTGGVYRLLNKNELFQSHGVVRLNDLGRFLTAADGYPEQHREYIVGMMKRFQLCFDMPGGAAILIPELLIKDEPALDWDAPGTLRFEYHYDVLPPGVLPRIIVLSHAKHTNPPTYWRSGVVMEDEGCRMMVRGDTSKNRVVIGVQTKSVNARGVVASKRLALKTVRNYFEEVHLVIRAKAMVPLPDDPAAPPVEFEYLNQLEQDEGLQYFWRPPGAQRKYTVGELLEGIESREERRQASTRAVRRLVDQERVIQVAGDYIEGNRYMGDDRSISVGGDNYGQAVTGIMENCTNIVNQQAPGKRKDLLEKLRSDVEGLIKQLPAEKQTEAPQIAENLETAIKQATKDKPDRKWYSLSAEGLMEAAKWVKGFSGEIGGTLKNLGTSIWPDFSLPKLPE